MALRTQRLSIRLLKRGVDPHEALRGDIQLRPLETLDGALTAFGTLGGSPPKWAEFLELTDGQKRELKNKLPYGLVFVRAVRRWFAVSFGIMHVKLDPLQFEERFGLRVVLNSVDPERIRSADLRTPDENTLSRRSQTSRGSRQEAFSIDIERDIVQGLAGVPKDPDFATRVAGSDALAMDKKMDLRMLQSTCAAAYRMSRRSDYKTHFAWIDHVRHVRSKELTSELEQKAVEELDRALTSGVPGDLGLAFPVVYNPESTKFIRYRRFGSRELYTDLEIWGYLDAMRKQGLHSYTDGQFLSHTIHEVDDAGRNAGAQWKISECLVFEATHKGKVYVLSAGHWYEIDATLASSVATFFSNIPEYPGMPPAQSDDNEVTYNARVRDHSMDLLCLDRRMIKPSGARTPIEVCDFLSKSHDLIHVKDRTSSSRLSHLFNQGTVSSRVLITDGPARDLLRREIRRVAAKSGLAGFSNLVPGRNKDFDPRKFTVVYAVLGTGNSPRLPFFSLVTLRQAVTEIRALGYQCAFAWIAKDSA